MPTYEYECRECGGRVEAFQKMSDDPLTTCADCGGSLRKLMFPVGIVFKGTGFYVNDYKNKESGGGGNGKSTGPSDSDSKPSAEKSSSEKSSTESKPASSSSSTSSSS